MNEIAREMIRDLSVAMLEYDLLWATNWRGRWVVLEPGVGRLLKDASPAMRSYIDKITPRRARRFSSLSRARRFANRVGSRVQRWRRTPPNGGQWQRVSPWQSASRRVGYGFLTLLPQERP